MLRAVLTTGLILLFVAGPRLCCLLACLTAAPPTAAQHPAPNFPDETKGCGCCHHRGDPDLPPPSTPEPPKCPFEKWHDEAKLMLASPEQAKPVSGPSSGECYAESLWNNLAPVFGHGPEVFPLATYNSAFPFLLPVDILHHLRTYRC